MKNKRDAGTARMAVLGAVTIAALAAVFGVTASNTVPSTKAGDGTGTISGYTISDVAYTLDATDPSQLDQVVFSLDTEPSAGAPIKVKLVSSGSTWYACSNTTTSVTCDTTSPQATVASADELRVVVGG